jgi:type I restriction enzyme S subunit
MGIQYKDSGIEWIGKIPVEWSVCKIKNLCSNIYSGGTPDSNNLLYWDGDIPWIPSGSCHDSIIYEAPKFITQLGYENSSTKLIPANTTVMAMTGATCGNVGFVTFETCMNQSVTGYITKDDSYSKFLFYCLLAAREDILTHKTGGAQSGINGEDCKNIAVPFIPKIIQQRIADYLDEKCGEIDSLVGLQEQMIEKLKDYKQSVITEAVTKGLNPNANLVPSGITFIGDVPEKWEIVPLRYLGRTQNGISKSGDYFGEGEPFVSYSDVYKNYSLPSNITGLAKSTKQDQVLFSVEEGDVFFTRTSETIDEIGFSSVCLSTINKAVFAGFLIRFRPYKNRLNKNFSKYYFRSSIHRAYFVKEMNLVTRASLSQELLKSMPVLLPPLGEQQAIASYLDEKCADIDRLIGVKQQKIEKLKDYKKSVIYEAVTGKACVNFS